MKSKNHKSSLFLRITLAIVLCCGVFASSLAAATSFEKIRKAGKVAECKPLKDSRSGGSENPLLPEDPNEESNEDNSEDESKKYSENDLVSFVRNILFSDTGKTNTFFGFASSKQFSLNNLPLYILFHSWKTFLF